MECHWKKNNKSSSPGFFQFNVLMKDYDKICNITSCDVTSKCDGSNSILNVSLQVKK